MGISKVNSEGYYDPTNYEALTHIEAEQRALRQLKARVYRPLVYICSPYSGDVLRNTRKARTFSRFAVRQGAIPVTPHLLYPQFMDDKIPAERDLGRFFALVLLGKCEQLWVFGNDISPGMAREISQAESKGIPIRCFSEDCEEVSCHV